MKKRGGVRATAVPSRRMKPEIKRCTVCNKLCRYTTADGRCEECVDKPPHTIDLGYTIDLDRLDVKWTCPHCEREHKDNYSRTAVPWCYGCDSGIAWEEILSEEDHAEISHRWVEFEIRLEARL